MSYTFTLSGESSVLSDSFNPPIYLDDNFDYEIGLANFDSFNSIPNVDETNNVLVWGEHDQYRFEIPVGSYEIRDIIKIIEKNMLVVGNTITRVTGDSKTSTVTIKSDEWINFNVDNSVGKLLGFQKVKLEPNVHSTSTHKVQILKVNTICIDCNIAAGSFLNGKPVHLIHQFFPQVPSGYKIVEQPLTILYYPVSIKTINNITVKVLDQESNLVNFRNETITVRLHLRKVD